jgi:hypothetical protein
MHFLVDVTYISEGEEYEETLNIEAITLDAVEGEVKRIYNDWNISCEVRRAARRDLISIDSIIEAPREMPAHHEISAFKNWDNFDEDEFDELAEDLLTIDGKGRRIKESIASENGEEELDETHDSAVMNEMPLEDFLIVLQRDINRFKKYWEEGVLSKENFPETLTEGDWFEQFLTFTTG